jgi:4-hydroxyphenylpyruvate dioxygenase-like putative hemolysin
MSTTAEPPAPVAVEAPPAPSLFDSIDWKNPVVGVTKIATHLQSLTSLTPSERLTMLQGSLTFVINTSPMSDDEKSAALLFVKTMVPHLVETAMSALAAEAAVAAAEKKAADVISSIMSKQPTIIVKNVEELLASAVKRKWCGW